MCFESNTKNACAHRHQLRRIDVGPLTGVRAPHSHLTLITLAQKTVAAGGSRCACARAAVSRTDGKTRKTEARRKTQQKRSRSPGTRTGLLSWRAPHESDFALAAQRPRCCATSSKPVSRIVLLQSRQLILIKSSTRTARRTEQCSCGTNECVKRDTEQQMTDKRVLAVMHLQALCA